MNTRLDGTRRDVLKAGGMAVAGAVLLGGPVRSASAAPAAVDRGTGGAFVGRGILESTGTSIVFSSLVGESPGPLVVASLSAAVRYFHPDGASDAAPAKKGDLVTCFASGTSGSVDAVYVNYFEVTGTVSTPARGGALGLESSDGERFEVVRGPRLVQRLLERTSDNLRPGPGVSQDTLPASLAVGTMIRVIGSRRPPSPRIAAFDILVIG